MKKDKKSVLYINYSPYENSGKILDYLLENFSNVYLFSIAFHPLGKNQQTNKIIIYKDKKIVSQESMHYINVGPRFVFIMIPIRSTLNLMQLLWHVIKINREYGKIDIFFSVNAFTAWGGMILKQVGLVKKTVFWVWDYYPIRDERPIVSLMRWFYWQFDKMATNSDRVIYLNNRLADVRKKAGIIKSNKKVPIVAIGTDIGTSKIRKLSKIIKIGFIGVIKDSQGLDMIFDSAAELKKNFPGITIEIIGSGPDEKIYKLRAKKEKIKVNFYGYVDEKKFERILSKCTIGIAPYVPYDTNLSFYGDPGKVKRYLSFGLPAIITDVFEFSTELVKEGAGLVIEYGDPQNLIYAIRKITKNYNKYTKNAVKLNKKFYYKDIYPKLFAFKD